MKRLFSLSFLCLILFSHGGNLEVWYDVFPPFLMDPGNRQFPGYAVELAEKVLGPAGFRIQWRRGNWGNVVSGFNQGETWRYQAVIGVHPADIPGQFFSAEPLFSLQSALYVNGAGEGNRKKRPVTVPPGKVFPEGRGAVPLDWSHSENADAELKRKAVRNELRQFPSAVSAARGTELLLSGRVRFMADEVSAVRWTLFRMKKSDSALKQLTLFPNRTPFHLMFSRSKSEAVKASKVFDSRLREFRKTTEYRDLRRKYRLSPKE